MDLRHLYSAGALMSQAARAHTVARQGVKPASRTC